MEATKVLTLQRVLKRPDATVGVLMLDDPLSIVCVTLERPWVGNTPEVSCIPAGTYKCVRGVHRLSEIARPFETFQVTGVPNRSGILFHSGNKPEHTKGCILVGAGIGLGLIPPFITSSIETFRHFMAVLTGVKEFELRVT